ncbi:MAG: acyl-CoA dehydratase activase [Synergistaceae bacterium]|jgi:predicted CoA-substrate-specific enzyme activase|nr:acyl-CoA dehydratase activase [Synergistaceae bacterium]
MSFRVGLDLGSTAIKAVFAEEGKFLWRGVIPTAPGQESVASGLIETGLNETGRGRGDIAGIASTGYGKKLFTSAASNIDEITANAAGAYALSGGEARVVINVGGQDVKVIYLDGRGAVKDFKMNDKCAAGTGRFLELAARIIDAPISDFDRLAKNSSREVEINSTCVVFAESEIVSLMARGAGREDIVRAIYASVARRVAGMAGQCDGDGAVYLDGGAACNRGLAEALEDEMMTPVRVLDAPQYTVAYGAALSLG